MIAPFDRAIVLVLDSVGIGELPDAARYGDQGSNTLGNIARAVPLTLPRLATLGLGRIAPLAGVPAVAEPTGAFGKMAELSPGKDSTTGHWELMGVVLDKPFPVFPHGFPAEVIAEFERRIGRRTLGNCAASGTEIINRLGGEHLATGAPIVYTSADSVFQIAAHERIIPVDELYRMCEIAFQIAAEGLGVGRVIARPFEGEPGNFVRTTRRRDYSRQPAGETLLDRLTAWQIPVVAIGKIEDLFARRGISEAVHTTGDADGLLRVREAMARTSRGLILANLVDSDTAYGHRNDVAGYARNLMAFDARLDEVLGALRLADLLVVTADHGNDPTTASTDHSREYVPLLITGSRVRRGVDLGTRRSFADLGQTLAELFGVGRLAHGSSFLPALVEAHAVSS